MLRSRLVSYNPIISGVINGMRTHVSSPLLRRGKARDKFMADGSAGYFTTGHRMTAEELQAVQGRLWEE